MYCTFVLSSFMYVLFDMNALVRSIAELDQ